MAAETSAPISHRLALWGGGGFAKEALMYVGARCDTPWFCLSFGMARVIDVPVGVITTRDAPIISQIS